LVLIASIVAWPVAYYFMHKWIEDFAYRISIGWEIFLSGAVVTVLIALIAISYNAIKASLANPIKSIRYE
jgi:putative ABC transport system permease protein